MTPYLSLQSKQSQALEALPIFSGPLIIVITLLGASFYHKMPLEKSEQHWTLHLNFGCNITQHYCVPCLVHHSSHIFWALTCILQTAL